MHAAARKFLERPPKFGGAVAGCVFLAVLVLLAFSSLLDCDFVNFDDEAVVTKNVRLQGGLTFPGVRWALTTLYWGHWMPLTWLSHMLDIEMWALDPWGHHLTSLLLHIVNTILVFLVLSNYTGAPRRSLVAAALFALHPLRVEPVAWISARRDLLSTTFLLLALGGYRRYAREPNVKRYVVLMGAFLLGLASKPMLITLPACLLLLDFWPLHRLGYSFPNAAGPAGPSSEICTRTVILEKLPLLLISTAWIALTYVAEEHLGALRTFQQFPIGVRLSNAIFSYARYLGKTLWPANLTVYYPHPGDSLPFWRPLAAVVLVGGLTVLVWLYRRTHPYLLSGWFWYVCTLIPVIGLVQINDQAIADRYSYVPHIGVFVAVVWGLGALPSPPRFRSSMPSVVAMWMTLVVVPLASLALLTVRQAGAWKSSINLWSRVLESEPMTVPLAHYNRALAYSKAGDLNGAAADYDRAILLDPYHAKAYNNRGMIHYQTERFERAIDDFTRALEIDTTLSIAYGNRGLAYGRLGDYGKALLDLDTALTLDPSDAKAYLSRGNVYLRTGKRTQALSDFRSACRLNEEKGCAAWKDFSSRE